MKPFFFPLILIVLGACATPQSYDTGADRSRARIPAFSNANEIAPDEACYPGDARYEPTCLPVQSIGENVDGYAYPFVDDPIYAPPTAYLDLRTMAQTTALSRNFVLSEFAAAHQGRWAVVQPHMIEALQAIRNRVGPLKIGSGYRSPGHNKHVGGAPFSRHQYGDAVDLSGVEASLSEVRDACRIEGASYVKVYSSHVHCDWRNDPLDEAFFGTDHHDHDHETDSNDDWHWMHEGEEELWAAETIGE